MPDEMTKEERRALLDRWERETREQMTPFERHLHDTGLFDDVIHEEYVSPEREVPFNHCTYMGCADCVEIVRQGVVESHCTCMHHRSVN